MSMLEVLRFNLKIASLEDGGTSSFEDVIANI